MSAHTIAVLTFPFDLDGTLDDNPVTRPGTRLVRFSCLAIKALPLLNQTLGLLRKPFAEYACAYRFVFSICGAVSTQSIHAIHKTHPQALCHTPTYEQFPETAETTGAIKEYAKFSAPIHRL